MILRDELNARRANAGPIYLDRIEAAVSTLEQAGVLQTCKQTGGLAPDFALADYDGEGVAHRGSCDPVTP